MLTGVLVLACAEWAPAAPETDGPKAQVMLSHEAPPPPVLPYCDLAAPPLDGLAAGRTSWVLEGAWDKERPREVVTVNTRTSPAGGAGVLLVSCEARQDGRGELLAGSRQWVATQNADGSPGWSVQVSGVDGLGRRWWTQPRLASSARIPGTVELSGRYADLGTTTAVIGKATLFVAPPVAGSAPPPPDCPYVRPMRAPASPTLLRLDDVRVHAPAIDSRDARLRTTLSGEGASLRLDERWNWPKGDAAFGKVVEPAKEETFSFRVEHSAADGGFVHVCPSTLPPGASRR
ncbi:MAG: hypothetical protein EXR71_12575 [Myxococcales bacterium]|nr:hypothetical protein [Myxococcales bacterium]